MLTDAVIDISHHQGHPRFDLATGVLGVLHKATQGVSMRDPMYHANKEAAQIHGLFWGAYHFGVNASGSLQAKYFLDMVRPDDKTLLVLDYEQNHSQQTTMTLDQARDFVEYVAEKTGRYPGFYSGSLIKEQLRHKPKDQILCQCWLWIAQYGPQVKDIPPTWETWTMWQYTETGYVPGIGYCDRDRFNGDEAGLERLWKGAA